MITVEQARQFALSLPGATEQDHHGLDSFRVRGKIFATVPDGHHLRVMVDESTTLSAVEEYPGVCDAFYWGRRLACVVVAIDATPTWFGNSSRTPGFARLPRAWFVSFNNRA